MAIEPTTPGACPPAHRGWWRVRLPSGRMTVGQAIVVALSASLLTDLVMDTLRVIMWAAERLARRLPH